MHHHHLLVHWIQRTGMWIVYLLYCFTAPFETTNSMLGIWLIQIMVLLIGFVFRAWTKENRNGMVTNLILRPETWNFRILKTTQKHFAKHTICSAASFYKGRNVPVHLHCFTLPSPCPVTERMYTRENNRSGKWRNYPTPLQSHLKTPSC